MLNMSGIVNVGLKVGYTRIVELNLLDLLDCYSTVKKKKESVAK